MIGEYEDVAYKSVLVMVLSGTQPAPKPLVRIPLLSFFSISRSSVSGIGPPNDETSKDAPPKGDKGSSSLSSSASEEYAVEWLAKPNGAADANRLRSISSASGIAE